MSDPESPKSRFSDWVNPNFLLTVLSLIVCVTLAYGSLRTGIDQNSKGIADIKSRISAIEQQRGDFIELRADVKYIKQKIDRMP